MLAKDNTILQIIKIFFVTFIVSKKMQTIIIFFVIKYN